MIKMVVLLALIGSLSGRNSRQSYAPHERPRTRIRIPGCEHIPDCYRCSVCGSGFHNDTMTCPHCGVRFNSTRTDEQGLIEKADFIPWTEENEVKMGR